MQNIFYRASMPNARIEYECNCTNITKATWNELMKGAQIADKKLCAKIALFAGVIDEEQFELEINNPWYNPYDHYRTKTHIIYTHSAIEHFIKVY